MRLAPLLLALLLLPASLPLAGAAQGSYEVDATVALLEDGTARETRRITYDATGPIQWTFPVPDGAVFAGARDDRGATLQATLEGGDVRVRTTATGTDRHFTLAFTTTPETRGPFRGVKVEVAAASDSPVGIAAPTAPEGWRVLGARATDSATRGDDGAYRATGPASVEFLLLPPGIEDARPAEPVSGESVRRDAVAKIGATGVLLVITHTYDTEVYSPDWRIPLPPGATAVSASTPYGPAETTESGGQVRVALPYPSGFGLGAREFTVTLQLSTVQPHAGTFLRANISVPAGRDDDVTLTLLPDGAFVVTGVHAPDAQATSPLVYAAKGPLTVSVGLAPPPAPGRTRIDAGLFVVDADESLAAPARAVALNATELLATAADFADGGKQTRPFYVTYTDAPIFSWEEGFYTPGLNTIAIRDTDLAPSAADGRAHLEPVRTLVHEATHGLLDRMLPNGPRNVSFLDEGLARLAETRVERAYPDEVLQCTTQGGSTRCDRDSSRPTVEEVRAFYRSGRAFDAGWTAATASDEERGFLYSYSGFVFDAFDRRAPRQALPALLWHMTTLEWSGDAATDGETLADLLASHATELTRDELLYPGRALASGPVDAMYACLGALVAPAYPFDDHASAGRPADGCGALDAGRGTGANPAPPELPRATLVPGPGALAAALVLAAVAWRRR